MSIAVALAEVRARIEKGCAAARRQPRDVTLVAVSKTVDATRCQEAVDAGQLVLGENYAQELRDKARIVRGATWHFIGPLQRNKVKYVVGTAALIHSIDSLALLEAVSAHAQRSSLRQRCLLQVNVAQEAQKSGVSVEDLASLVDATRDAPGIELAGLMCIPPAEGDPRRHFAALRSLAERHALAELSMGMSGDYEAAIEEGATLVRVGTAIFGAREARA